MQHAELSPYENLVTQPSCFLLIRTLKSFCYHSYLVKFNTVTSRFIKKKSVETCLPNSGEIPLFAIYLNYMKFVCEAVVSIPSISNSSICNH